MPTSVAKILLCRGGAIGDFILTLPVLRVLKSAFPSSAIQVLAQPQVMGLATLSGLASSAHSLSDPRLATLFSSSGRVDDALMGTWAGLSSVVSYLHDPDHTFENHLQKLFLAQATPSKRSPAFLRGSPFILDGQEHAVEQLLRPLTTWGLHASESTWRAPLLARPAARSARPRVAIHAGSGSLQKNWPLKNWHALLSQLRQTYPKLEIVLISGEAEWERGTPDAMLLDEHWKGLPLTQLADRLTTCWAFIGHDSGISHLASTCGVPCLLLFGPTDPSIWAPPQITVQALKSPDGKLDLLEVSEVWTALQTFLQQQFDTFENHGFGIS